MNAREDQSEGEWKCLVEAQEEKGIRGGEAGYVISETSKSDDGKFRRLANKLQAGEKILFFEGTSVRRTDSLSQTAEPKPDEIIRKANPDTNSLNLVENTKNIIITLSPRDFSFYPFGSSKRFERIELTIYPIRHDSKYIERCFISAWHHTVYDDITLPRSCFFTLELYQEKFDEIWTALLEPYCHSISFGVSHGALHHEWDPIGSYTPSLVKLLLDEQEVVVPDGQDVNLVRISDDVATFNFSVSRNKDLEPQSTAEELSGAYENYEEPEEPELSFHQSLQEVMIAFWNVHGVRLAEDILFIKYGVYLVAGLLALLAYFNL